MAIVKTRPSPAPFARLVTDIASTREAMRQARISGLPIDVAGAASALGLKIQYEQMTDEMSGYLERRGSEWVIGVNSFHSYVRQRFTLAHELAHFVLHRDDQDEFRDVIFTRRSLHRDEREREADRFAAQLLMPETQLVADVESGVTNVNALAERYQVSGLAMKYRLQNLGYKVM